MKTLVVLIAVYSIMFCDCEAQGVVKDDAISFRQLPNSSPYSGIIQCYGITCPVGTVHCSTKSEVNADYTRWITNVECKDYYGNVLSSVVKSSALASPPFYSGQYDYGNGGYGGNDGYYNGDNYLYQWQRQQ